MRESFTLSFSHFFNKNIGVFQMFVILLKRLLTTSLVLNNWAQKDDLHKATQDKLKTQEARARLFNTNDVVS